MCELLVKSRKDVQALSKKSEGWANSTQITVENININNHLVRPTEKRYIKTLNVVYFSAIILAVYSTERYSEGFHKIKWIRNK